MTLPPPPPGTPADLLPGAIPPALFDLAVNRAAAALRGIQGVAAERAALAQWHARTRFARRIPLPDIAQALTQRPTAARGGEGGGGGPWHWTGGPQGGWQPGKAPFP